MEMGTRDRSLLLYSMVSILGFFKYKEHLVIIEIILTPLSILFTKREPIACLSINVSSTHQDMFVSWTSSSKPTARARMSVMYATWLPESINVLPVVIKPVV